MVMATADVTRSLYMGNGKFDGRQHETLRVAANLSPKECHLVLPEGESIDSLADLQGKRVGIARAKSGTQVAAHVGKTGHHPRQHRRGRVEQPARPNASPMVSLTLLSTLRAGPSSP
jgi:3-dehydroquinate synthase class II